MERLDGAGLQEVPKEARSLTSRAACCQSAIRRVESPLCCSHARQGLTSRHAVTPKRVNRVTPVTTRTPSNIRTAVPKPNVRGACHSGLSAIVNVRLPRCRLLESKQRSSHLALGGTRRFGFCRFRGSRRHVRAQKYDLFLRSTAPASGLDVVTSKALEGSG